MPGNDAVKAEKTSPIDYKQMGIESAVFAASNLPVTWFASGLQNIKVEKQLTDKTYPEAYKSLKMQGKKRFFSGYGAYTGRNMAASAISGPVLSLSAGFAERNGFLPWTGAVITTLAATAIETASTAYMEGTELNATKNLPSVNKGSWQDRMETAKRTARVAPTMYAKNIPFWTATVVTDLAMKDEKSEVKRNTAGFAAGLVAGGVSMPMDTIMTANYGTSKSFVQTAKEYGMKGLLKGAPVRSLQVGAYTAATVAAMSFLKKLETGRGAADQAVKR